MAYNKMAQIYRKNFMDNIDKIVSDYNNGITMKQLASEYKVSYQYCSEVFVKLGIKLNGRKYALNKDYFEVIDTPNKAYILGLWYADGCNQIRNNKTLEGKYHICISLQESDVDILNKIKNELHCNNKLILANTRDSYIDGRKICKENIKNQYALHIYSKKMSLDLEKHGVIQNKSLKLKFPLSLDENLYSHFIRGYFDGDGSIYKSDCKIGWSIVSTKDFCESVKEIIESKFGIQMSIEYNCHNNGITSVLRSQNKKNIKQILDWIYDDADLFIERKYNRYLDYFYSNNSLAA